MKKEALYTIGGQSFIKYDDGYLEGVFFITKEGNAYGYCREKRGYAKGHSNSYLDFANFVIIGTLRGNCQLDFYLLTEKVDESVLPLYKDKNSNYKAISCKIIDDPRGKYDFYRMCHLHYLPMTPELYYYSENSRDQVLYERHEDFFCRELAYSQKAVKDLYEMTSKFAHGDIQGYFQDYMAMFDSWENPYLEPVV